jgi:soluble lytic murein transglycosylase
MRRLFNLIAIFSIIVGCASTSKKAETSNQIVVGTGESRPLTIEGLAQELNCTPETLEENAELLAKYLEDKTSFEFACPDDESVGREELCKYLAEIEERPIERNSSIREKVTKLKTNNLEESQNLTYYMATRAVSKVPKETMLKWVPKFLAYDKCPRNLSAAAARKIEQSLPDPAALESIESLYNHSAECLKPPDPGYEITHFRQALLRLMNGNEDGARTALDLALKAEKPEERGRALYWQGILAKDPAVKTAAWDELTKKQPMTYHSLMVWKSQNKDPLKSFADSPDRPIERLTWKLTGRIQKSVQWLEALYLYKKPAAAEKLTRWISSVDGDLPADAVIYLGLLKNSNDQYHNAIKFLTESVVRNPEILSAAMLKQLYPVPYLEVFDRLSQGVDVFLVMGLARQESAFNSKARSTARAEGMMQILPRVARIKMQTKKRVNLYDIETNVKVGSKLLRDWIGQFGAVEYALIAYNAGPLRVNEWKRRYPTENLALFLDMIPFKETRNYVGSIIRNNYWYHRLYENDPNYKALRLQHPENEGSTYYSQIVKDLIQSHSN